jgi:hypothetical protein
MPNLHFQSHLLGSLAQKFSTCHNISLSQSRHFAPLHNDNMLAVQKSNIVSRQRASARPALPSRPARVSAVRVNASRWVLLAALRGVCERVDDWICCKSNTPAAL